MKIAVSINNYRLFSNSGWRPLSESAAMYRRLSGSAEVPASRLLWETSADWTLIFRYLFQVVCASSLESATALRAEVRSISQANIAGTPMNMGHRNN
jgi:hypothetical protein